MEILEVLTSVDFLNPALTAFDWRQINYKFQQIFVLISSIVLFQPKSSQILPLISIPQKTLFWDSNTLGFWLVGLFF